jgi:hypothetical protein
MGTFDCFAPPNDAPKCGVCDNMNGPFCKGGLSCLASGVCTRFCCDDGDCGNGTCVKVDGNGQALFEGIDVGLCLDSMSAAACSAPDVAPSMGKCVKVVPK